MKTKAKTDVMPQIMFTLDKDSFHIKCDWSDETIDTNNFGIMIAMLNNGVFKDLILEAVLAKSDDPEVYKKIIDSADVFSKSIMPENVNVIDFDDDKVENSLIVWEKYEDNDDDNDDEENEMNEEAMEILQIPGVPGFLSHEQFNKLVNKIRCSIPRLEDRDNWVGHTNFSITNKLYNTISNMRGVEFIARLGRYSFVITTGKAFNSLGVQTDIEKSLNVSKSVFV